MYIMGQVLILTSVNYGDVSVAAPVASVKVVVVTVLAAFFSRSVPTTGIWIAALLAMVGVILINAISPQGNRKQILWTAALAFGGASTFALFDICVQQWAPQWGDTSWERLSRFVPISYLFVGVFSLALVPFCQWAPRKLRSMAWGSLLLGSLLVAVQAICLVIVVSVFQDAARVNVVYSLRGLWAVVFAWFLAETFRGQERHYAAGIMFSRLCGAMLLVLAVVIAVFWGDS